MTRLFNVILLVASATTSAFSMFRSGSAGAGQNRDRGIRGAPGAKAPDLFAERRGSPAVVNNDRRGTPGAGNNRAARNTPHTPRDPLLGNRRGSAPQPSHVDDHLRISAADENYIKAQFLKDVRKRLDMDKYGDEDREVMLKRLEALNDNVQKDLDRYAKERDDLQRLQAANDKLKAGYEAPGLRRAGSAVPEQVSPAHEMQKKEEKAPVFARRARSDADLNPVDEKIQYVRGRGQAEGRGAINAPGFGGQKEQDDILRRVGSPPAQGAAARRPGADKYDRPWAQEPDKQLRPWAQEAKQAADAKGAQAGGNRRLASAPSKTVEDLLGGSSTTLPSWREKFVMQKELGRGGFGVAKLAKRISDGELVVLKFFPALKGGSKFTTWKEYTDAKTNSNIRTTIVTARNECAWAKKIQENKSQYRSTQYFMDCFDTNIVSTAAEKTPSPTDELYVELSYGGMPLDSTDVQKALNLKRNRENAKEIISQLTASLAFLKKLKIVHHDLKPNNIMYDVAKNMVCVIDFGAMSWESKANLVPTFTIGYAPYQFEASVDLKEPVSFDVFSIGGVFSYLFAGKNLLQKYVTVRPRQNPVTNWDNFDRDVVKSDSVFQTAVAQAVYDTDFASTKESAVSQVNGLSQALPGFFSIWRNMMAKNEGARIKALDDLLVAFLS